MERKFDRWYAGPGEGSVPDEEDAMVAQGYTVLVCTAGVVVGVMVRVVVEVRVAIEVEMGSVVVVVLVTVVVEVVRLRQEQALEMMAGELLRR